MRETYLVPAKDRLTATHVGLGGFFRGQTMTHRLDEPEPHWLDALEDVDFSEDDLPPYHILQFADGSNGRHLPVSPLNHEIAVLGRAIEQFANRSEVQPWVD